MARSLELDQKSRNELVEEARGLGVDRPERMTRVELADEIIRRTTPASEQAEARGLFGVARSMLASVVESGLNLPEAASVIRGNATPAIPLGSQAPVATVTLAEIYASQGHKGRALRMVEEVLLAEPDHQEALRVKAELLKQETTTFVRAVAPQATTDKERASAKPEPAATPSGSSPSGSSPLGSSPLGSSPLGPSATSEYIPEGFVETTGEEIQTGKPPQSTFREDPTKLEEAPVSELPPSGTASSEPEKYDPEDIPESQRLTEVPGVTEDVISASDDVLPLTSPNDEPSGVMEKPVNPASPSDSIPPQSDSTPPQSSDKLINIPAPISDAPALVLRHQGNDVQAYWELPASVLAQCGVDPAEGAACLRIVAIIPAGAHPERREHTYYLHQGKRLSQDTGQMRIEAIGSSAAVRAALGWLLGDSFLPICVGKSLAQLSTDPSQHALLARVQVHWS